jgi:uncharacterized protein YjdB
MQTTVLKAISVRNGAASAVLDTIVTVTATTYSITVPTNATVFVGAKDNGVNVQGNYLYMHYVPFSERRPAYSTDNSGKTTYYYALGINSQYNYRISRAGSLTHVGLFRPTATAKSMEITEAQLTSHLPTEIDHDVNNLASRNVADVWLNINAQGHLTLPLLPDTVFQVITQRNWQAIDTDVNNYFIDPDFHYTIVDESGAPSSGVISISDSGMIKPVGIGTAIVLVTYDAMLCAHTTNVGNNGNAFFGALWPENTGVFVVTVTSPGAAAPGISRNMYINEYWNAEGADKVGGIDIDAEHDVVYYEAATGGFDYTFKPDNALAVSIAQPAVGANIISYSGFVNVPKNTDNSYTVRLVHGRNIIRLSGASGSVYQVITAKPVSWTVNNFTSPGSVPVPGDSLTVTFSTLYHPSNKLSGIYNMSAGIQYTGFATDFPLILGPGQYTFASKAQTYGRRIPDNYNGDEVTLINGVIKVRGYGSFYGEHRKITAQNGVAPNLNASVRTAYFGSLPDIHIRMQGQPPTTPTNLIASPVDASSVFLQWTASTDNVGVAGYTIWVNGDSTASVQTVSCIVPGLDANTAYTFDVAAFDAAGNRSAKATATATTPSAGSPPVAVTGIALSHTTAEMNIGGTLQLSAYISPANATNKAVTWTSSSPNIVSVNSNGLVTAIIPGSTAVITATTADGGKSATCTITTKSADIIPNPFELTQKILSLYPGQTVVLSLTAPQHFNVTWSSTNPAIATVSPTGTVTSIAEGTTRIIARDVVQGRSDTCTVTVEPLPAGQPAGSISLNTSALSLLQGETFALSVTTSPGLYAQPVQWTSTNGAVANVTSSGTVAALAPGTAIIRATIGNYSATCTVTVDAPRQDATIDNIEKNDARLTFPKSSGATYYLVHLYRRQALSLIPFITLKVRPDGSITLLSTVGSNMVVPLTYLASGTSYMVEIETIRDSRGKAEVVQTETLAFTTKGTPSGNETVDIPRPIVRYENGALRIMNMERFSVNLYSISGQFHTRFTVKTPDERHLCPLPQGIYLVTGEKDAEKIVFKIVVH